MGPQLLCTLREILCPCLNSNNARNIDGISYRGISRPAPAIHAGMLTEGRGLLSVRRHCVSCQKSESQMSLQGT